MLCTGSLAAPREHAVFGVTHLLACAASAWRVRSWPCWRLDLVRKDESPARLGPVDRSVL